VRVNVYVDAFNLYYGCLRGTPYRWLDLEALSRRYIRKEDELHRIRYFTARVSPRPGDERVHLRQQAYLRALHTIPCLSIHFGRFQQTETRMHLAQPPARGPSTALVVKTEEKGSDVNLASYLLLDAFRGDYETALVISNDSDLCTPIEMAKNELKRRVGILNPHRVRSRDLASIPPTFSKQIRSGALRDSQFPDLLNDERGSVRRPDSW
jgi:NYN domain